MHLRDECIIPCLGVIAMGKKTEKEVPPRIGHAIVLLVCIATVSLCTFFYHIRILVRPWPYVLDAENKDDDPSWAWWEVLLCCAVPIAGWCCKRRLASVLIYMMLRRKATIMSGISFFFVVVILLQLLVFRPPCRDGWVQSDVGYLEIHQGGGHNMHAICHGHVWEPHVAKAVEDYLHGQGRAMDVGAYIGYHTVRLAKAAAPYTVYAVEGRTMSSVKETMKRNNVRNVKLINEVIGSSWKLDSTIEKDLLNDDLGPLAFIKIDCEGCELFFLKGAKTVIERWHPVLAIEIQDDDTRQKARLGGQKLVKSTTSRQGVLDYLRDELGYTSVTPLVKDGKETWDYLAMWL